LLEKQSIPTSSGGRILWRWPLMSNILWSRQAHSDRICNKIAVRVGSGVAPRLGACITAGSARYAYTGGVLLARKATPSCERKLDIRPCPGEFDDADETFGKECTRIMFLAIAASLRPEIMESLAGGPFKFYRGLVAAHLSGLARNASLLDCYLDMIRALRNDRSERWCVLFSVWQPWEMGSEAYALLPQMSPLWAGVVSIHREAVKARAEILRMPGSWCEALLLEGSD